MPDPLVIEDLRNWTEAGGHWRIVELSGEEAVVSLCACTGEPMDRALIIDPATIEYLKAAPNQD